MSNILSYQTFLRFPHGTDIRFAFFFCRRAHVFLCYLYLFAYSGVQHIVCCVFVFFVLCLVYQMFPVSLDCPFLIVPSVFSDVYLLTRHALFTWWNTLVLFIIDILLVESMGNQYWYNLLKNEDGNVLPTITPTILV